MTIRNILREPLLHFFILSGLLFVAYAALNRDGLRAPGEIVVDQSRLNALARQFGSTWRRPPSRAELQQLADDWVREEVLFREGTAAGLEKDDAVVRRRVVQKMQFMADGVASGAAPTEAELQAWLDAHPADYQVEPSYSFAQVFFDPQQHSSDLDVVLARTQDMLATNPSARVGDRTLLPRHMPLLPRSEIVRAFGSVFADALATLPDGLWRPVRSGFGMHLVRVEQRVAGRHPALAEVRAEVERDLLRSRSEAAAQTAYTVLRKRYEVRIEGDMNQALNSAAQVAQGTQRTTP